MKKFATLIAAALLAAACATAPEFDPVKEAINAKLSEMVKGEITSIAYESLILVDSTTFGSELNYRKGLMEERINRNEELRLQYKAEHKVANVTAKKKAIAKDQKILKGLEKIGDRLGDQADSIAYYTYRFTAAITSGDSILACKDYRVTITPDLEIINMTGDKNKVRFGAGSVLPGYDALVKESEEE